MDLMPGRLKIPQSKSSRESSITVAVRVRPFTDNENSFLINNNENSFFLGDGSFSSNKFDSRKNTAVPKGIRRIINVVDDKMLIFDPPETNPLIAMQKNAFPNANTTTRIREHRFVFDQLFDDSASQEDVYNSTTRPLIDCVLEGYNSTIFAYGATGCGKTYTISGTQQDPGIIFLTMKELYERIDELADTKKIELSLSFLEIYNESIRDLLNPETEHKRLCLREDANNKISVSNLSSHSPKSVDEVMDLILLGNQNRTCSPTEANSTSSRSHAVLQINAIQKNRTADVTEAHTFATLSIIDLAGSERAAATKNRGIRLNEGANINKSLLALGNCINALCDPRRRNHIPYRDSKLTRLLKFSLGGNCKTVMIVCVSPSSQHYDETLNTLKYADRAKQIKTKLIKNQHNLDRHVGSYLKMITEQKQEIEELRNRESKIVEITINKQILVNEKCLNLVLESIQSLRESLGKQHHDKWKKYFILAKRKVLFVQKIEIETLLKGFSSISIWSHPDQIRTIVSLSEQLMSKVDSQISDLESRYSNRSEIDHIFIDSSQHILRKHKEIEGWGNYNTLIFEKFVDSLKESLEKEILFNSSILFDYLIHELGTSMLLPSQFLECFAAFIGNDNIGSNQDMNELLERIIQSLEFMANGEFDSTIESLTSSFMQKKLKEEEVSEIYNKSKEFSSNLKNPSILHKTREFKRGPVSPLKVSPPRNFKRTIAKKPLMHSVSPIRLKSSKKVRWDVPPSEINGDSDLSMEENTHNNTILKSDYEEDSPIGNSILDKSILIDDLDLKYNTEINSPPLINKIVHHDIMKDMTNQKDSKAQKPMHFSNKRLSIDLSESNSMNNSKLPLLNKQASTKIKNQTQNLVYKTSAVNDQ